MLIVTIKTDQVLAEVGFFNDESKLGYQTWEAHRTLTDTIHVQIKKLLDDAQKDWKDIEGVVVFKGPGSFTGLRIGFAVANTLAYINKAPIVSTIGDLWLKDGLEKLLTGHDEHIALPEYGADVHITTPKK
jgi:tRNA threonylcarbamoyladenosine biosynthesis protein TsaB